MSNFKLYHANGEEILKNFDDNSVDSLVIDPPSGISFMGNKWDSDKGGKEQWIAWLSIIMKECLRVLKPGAHGFVWGLPRTSHWTATAIENAGFEIKDIITHHFSSGFPKGQNIAKAMDKAARGYPQGTSDPESINHGKYKTSLTEDHGQSFGAGPGQFMKEKGVIENKKFNNDWNGWNTTLKPATEHWILCRKPISEKNIITNINKWQTGAINIDECRVESDNRPKREVHELRSDVEYHGTALQGRLDGSLKSSKAVGTTDVGRWPSNLLFTHHPDCIKTDDKQYSGKEEVTVWNCVEGCPVCDLEKQMPNASRYYNVFDYQDNFMYCAKASKSERDAGVTGESKTRRTMGEGMEGVSGDRLGDEDIKPIPMGESVVKNIHPTVKSIKLSRWLCKLITPPNGVVLDCFMGSGTTGIAAIQEGFNFIGIENNEEYFNIAKDRMEYWSKRLI